MSPHESFENSDAVPGLNAIALHAMNALLASKPPHEDKVKAKQKAAEIQAQLLDVVTDCDAALFDQAIITLTNSGMSHEHLANHHIPKLARTLGQAWVDGKMAFTDVSIGCARLQGYLRHKGLEWCDKAQMTSNSVGSVLLAVPDFEQHTLGATLLAGQLRAQGYDVTLAFHVPSDEIAKIATKNDYNAIMISSSRSETLALLADTVRKVKNVLAHTPVVLGGNLLEQTSDILKKTGADFTANCWQDVLGILMPSTKKICADPIGR